MTKKKKVITLSCITAASLLMLAIFIAYLFIALLPRQSNYGGKNPMMKDGETPLLIAHGGGNGEFPDNTLEAFYNAYDASPDVMMETDVCLTKDGVLILSHDVTLDRKTNVTGKISDWNYSELISEKVNFGYTNETTCEDDGELVPGSTRKFFLNDEGVRVLPVNVDYPKGISARDSTVFLATTLEELIKAFPNNKINVEIKQSGEMGIKALDEAVRLIEKYNAYDRVVLASFHPEIYDELKSRLKSGKLPEELMFSPATSGATKYYILQLLKLDRFFTDRVCVLQLPTERMGFDLATRSVVNTAHKHNIAVHYWTIDDPDEMRELIELGADGIMTNYPHRLKAVYDSYEDGTK